MMAENEFEIWLKSAASKFVEIYTNGHSSERMNYVFVVLQVIFGFITISCLVLLVSNNFINVGQFLGTKLGMTGIQKIVSESPALFSIILLFSILFSLLSLWVMKQYRVSRKHMSEFYYFWDRHIESGRKLLKEN